MESTDNIAPAKNPFVISLDLFDGPVDLLLHLVKKHELQIEKISLAIVASQYMAAIDSIKELDLEVAGEYLVIAAVLLSIKASVLLNDPVELVADDEGNLIDPHEELLQRLKEASIYKDGAKFLSHRFILGLDVFENLSPYNLIEAGEVGFKKQDAVVLAKAFKQLISKVSVQLPNLTFIVDPVSITERMKNVLDFLRKGTSGRRTFSDVILNIASENRFVKPDKGRMISSFLAILELCKRGALDVEQEDELGEIYVVLAGVGITGVGITGDVVIDDTEEVNLA